METIKPSKAILVKTRGKIFRFVKYVRISLNLSIMHSEIQAKNIKRNYVIFIITIKIQDNK